MLPHTTKRRTTNLKTKNNQNCQKIKLYGSPTTKELKKKHSSRLVGGADLYPQPRQTAHAARPWTGQVRWQWVAWAVPHSHASKPGGTTGGRGKDHATQGSTVGK